MSKWCRLKEKALPHSLVRCSLRYSLVRCSLRCVMLCPVQMVEDAGPRQELGRTFAVRGGSGGSSSPWQLWQPGICSPTELGVQQLNP